jgi:hypothetical protein
MKLIHFKTVSDNRYCSMWINAHYIVTVQPRDNASVYIVTKDGVRYAAYTPDIDEKIKEINEALNENDSDRY